MHVPFSPLTRRGPTMGVRGSRLEKRGAGYEQRHHYEQRSRANPYESILVMVAT